MGNAVPFFEDLYTEHLTTINGVKFTRREIDVIACLLNARGTSKIASFLSVALRTVMTHTRNIMRKIDCNSKESIIDFFERSDAIAFLREYYVSLVTEVAFKKSLKEISKLTHEKGPDRLLIYWHDPTLKLALLHHLPLHLSQIGMHVEVRDHVLNHKSENSHTILLIEKQDPQKIPPEFSPCESVDLSEAPNYYAAVFEVLKKLMANSHFDQIITDFWDQMRGIQNISVNNVLKNDTKSQPQDSAGNKTTSFISRKRVVIGTILLLSFLAMGLIVLKIELPHARTQGESIRSDLIIPAESSLLHRSDLITQIDKKLKSQEGVKNDCIDRHGGCWQDNVGETLC